MKLLAALQAACQEAEGLRAQLRRAEAQRGALEALCRTLRVRGAGGYVGVGGWGALYACNGGQRQGLACAGLAWGCLSQGCLAAALLHMARVAGCAPRPLRRREARRRQAAT